MRQLPASAARLAASLAAVVLLGTGCGVAAEQEAEPSSAPNGSGVPEPATGEHSPVTVHLTVPAWSPGDVEGRAYGCGDLLVPVQTVPVKTSDPAAVALDFLLEDVQGEHGDPTLENAVAGTADSLSFVGHERAGDTEVFSFSGEVTAADACTAAQIRAQLEETARSQSAAAEVRLEVGGVPLDDVLGLDPLELEDPTSLSGEDEAGTP